MKSRLKQQIFAISLLVCTAISPANALQTPVSYTHLTLPTTA